MSGVYPKLHRAAVRDSFDDEDLSDVDDEVFIRDGKNGILKIDDDCGVKRPLMAPRRKCKAHFSEATHIPYKTLFAPFCYTLLGFAVVLGIIVLCIIIITHFPMPANLLKNWLYDGKEKTFDKQHIVPCTSLDSAIQWTRTLPKLTSEAPLRSNDVNGDSIEDIIVGFSTGLDKAGTPEYICSSYFDQSAPCLGGVLALDGKSGETIWTHWTAHAIFSVDCGLDLTGDKVKDCIIAGRGGILHAINGQDGSSLWELPYRDLSMLSQQRFYDVYDARYIADVDDDGVGDIIASHTWQADGSQSEVILVSGKSGNKLNSMDFPGKEQLFVAPQIIVHPDGETYFILAASDQQKSGGLYIIPHSKLLKGEFKLQQLYYGPGKGVSLPPILIDINSDGTEDIIVAIFNSTIIAFDGLTFKEIWNFTIANSEVISIPIPGYYNDDKVPDFMVKHQIGPGFPVYYYTTATILDGKTGKPILESPMEDTMSAQMSGLSVTVDGHGNDWFLHWSADCLNKEGAKDEYAFYKNPTTDADLCKLRFNSSIVTSLYAFSQHIEPPGIPLYRSADWRKLEFNNSIDPRKEAEEYANRHAAEEASPSQSRKHKPNAQQKSVESEDFPEAEGYYPKKTFKYSNVRAEQQAENFLDKAMDELSVNNNNNNENNENNDWKENWESEKSKEVGQSDDTYDDAYDDVEDRLIASRQLNEIRLQRSEKANVRYINNDTNDVENQLDPSMDYTNGQSKQNNYYSSLTFNRSNNVEDSSDYMNIPDIDFVDNIKDAEALDDRRKRESKETTPEGNESHRRNERNESHRFNEKNGSHQLNERSENHRRNERNESHQLKEGNEGNRLNERNEGHRINERNESHQLKEGNKNHRLNERNESHQLKDGNETHQLNKRNENHRRNERNESHQLKDGNESNQLNEGNEGHRINERSAKVKKITYNPLSKMIREYYRRLKREESPFQPVGIQKQPPTGILLPSLKTLSTTSTTTEKTTEKSTEKTTEKSTEKTTEKTAETTSTEKTPDEGKHSVDLVFSTYWLPPAPTPFVLVPRDLECLNKAEGEAASNNVELTSEEREAVVDRCLAARGVDYRSYEEATDKENERIPLGQMTVYRMRLRCACPEDVLPGQACKDVGRKQSWPQHLGATGGGHFEARRV